MNQRWHKGDTRWSEGKIDVDRYHVGGVSWKDARDFVVDHHYSRSFVAARERYGLYRNHSQSPDELVGVAIFSQPVNARSLTNFFGAGKAVELGRFVLLDSVEGNGESHFLARCMDDLRKKDYTGILSFSDPLPRSTADGREIFVGHVGQVYQATNAVHAGRGRPQVLKLLPDGTSMTEDNFSKIRRMIEGWEYSARRLQAFGADEVWVDRPKAWLAHWVVKLCRPLRHPGNFRYLWGLDRKTRKQLPDPQPYPKKAAV